MNQIIECTGCGKPQHTNVFREVDGEMMCRECAAKRAADATHAEPEQQRVATCTCGAAVMGHPCGGCHTWLCPSCYIEHDCAIDDEDSEVVEQPAVRRPDDNPVPAGLWAAGLASTAESIERGVIMELLIDVTELPGIDPRGCFVRCANGAVDIIPNTANLAPGHRLDLSFAQTRDAVARWMLWMTRPVEFRHYSTAPRFQLRAFFGPKHEPDRVWAVGGDYHDTGHDPEFLFVGLLGKAPTQHTGRSPERLPDGSARLDALAMATCARWLGKHWRTR